MNPIQYSVQTTALWQHLNSGFVNTDSSTAQILAAGVATLCDEASNRMRGFPALHPQYTLHDEVHLLRVTQLMAQVMPTSVLQILNPVEVTLLILAAHFHDQGMVPDASELERWREDSANPDPAFALFRQNWALEHPNLEAVHRQLNDSNVDAKEKAICRRVEADLLSALLSDYLRVTHGQRSAQWLRDNYGQDPRLRVQGVNITEALARLCQSHVGPVSALTEANGFRVDERIGMYSVNMVYLALILRLADILDFDRERTPDSLYRTIDFRSPISLEEWAKHRSVVGWTISPDTIQFTIECEHPEYERAARRFMDYIDEELQNAIQRVREFPKRAANYTLDLPVRTDRSRIKPKNDAYIYYDLEFSLSRDEVVKLLMTDKLYGSPALCVRELLQNSLDALRHRSALFKRTGVEWQDGRVKMFHELDTHGHEVLRCVDNGIGMTRDIILNFLTNAGRSYYRSPQFEQERIGLRAAGVDFDPCAQFGIGFMSVFMLGDHVVIQTRRDNGPASGYGEPLVVEINGIGGIITLRPGLPDQSAGTTVTITGRKKPRYMDDWNDKVQLTSVLLHFALATEFPIEATCAIKEIEEAITIPATYAVPKTAMEKGGLCKLITIEQQLNEIHPGLGGCLRASFIVDDNNVFTLANDEARWDMVNESGLGVAPELYRLNADGVGRIIIQTSYMRGSNAITVDGILITGKGDREQLEVEQERRHLTRVTTYGSEGNGRIVYLLDARNTIKPPLTPARAPIGNGTSDNSPRWNFVYSLLGQGKGRLWEQVAQTMNASECPELFWQLNIIYNEGRPSATRMRTASIWQHLSVPTTVDNCLNRWVPIKDLGIVHIISESISSADKKEREQDFDDYMLYTSLHERISSYGELNQWGRDKHSNGEKTVIPSSRDIDWAIKVLIGSISTLIIQNGKPALEVRSPDNSNISPADNIYSTGSYFEQSIWTIPYSGEASNFFSVHSPLRSMNRNHPLAQGALAIQHKENLSDFEHFLVRLLNCLTNPKLLHFLLNPSHKSARWFLELGSRFAELNWTQINSQYHPPYKIRLLDGKSVDITQEVFKNWAS